LFFEIFSYLKDSLNLNHPPDTTQWQT